MREPIATDLRTRDGTTAQDAKIVNGFVEAGQAVFKRPAINTVLATASGQAQGGIYNVNGLGYFINGDVVKSYNAAFALQQTISL
jgi:hypothetical protein